MGKTFFQTYWKDASIFKWQGKGIFNKRAAENAYFAHLENVILRMLAEDDEDFRRTGVDKTLELSSEISATTEMESSTLESNRKDVVRQFRVPKVNVEVHKS